MSGAAAASSGAVDDASGTTVKAHADSYKYMAGFGNLFASEALEGALPWHNSPQVCPYGLYAEQLSGTAFTCPRKTNQSVWMYRILPACKHEPYAKVDAGLLSNDFSEVTPQQMRWSPPPMPAAGTKVDFVHGLVTYGGAGSPQLKTGYAVHMYACNASMVDSAFYSSDGDMLIVPQMGTLRVKTELGVMQVAPGEICVVQRGIRFAVELLDAEARGYVCEVFVGHFTLPDLGPMGAHALACPRDFLSPVAWYEDRECDFTVYNKYAGELFAYKSPASVFNVVAFRGNYVPFKYDLARFNTMNSVSFDHPDPSIYCVLTCQTTEPGVAALDFVIFPPRWSVHEHTFRPPYYHRNVMSEFMGLIRGKYEAKEEGFVPGGASLHSVMAGHGPDAEAFYNHSRRPLLPERIQVNDLAFMFESTFFMTLTKWAAKAPTIQQEYYKCWTPLKKFFNPQDKNAKIE